jgi:signal transduction histidine kinase
MNTGRSFTARLTLALALLLLAYGAFVAVLGRQVAVQHEQEALQRLSHGLARHIVEHWPEITLGDIRSDSARDQADRAAREALLGMLMVVNPGVQVYVLDADGRVAAYLGEPGMVRQPHVDLVPVNRFLGGSTLPLRGTDPMGGASRIFSAAMFPPRPGDVRPPGYLYVVLDGAAREQVAGQLSLARVWWGAALAAAAGMAVTLLIGAFTLRRLTMPLRQLARRIGSYRLPQVGAAPAAAEPSAAARGDEVRALDVAFTGMAERIENQATREQQQVAAHRETMASVAHDLRTPLTALHGQLEALAGSSAVEDAARQQMLGAALAQSDKVRHLSQQLFELAALQTASEVMHRERFSLDELVTDAVQKFGLIDSKPPVTLDGPAPGRLELDGDLQLIERALTNLIDNALRHAAGALPVRVSLRRSGALAQIWVEDGGPGLPAELRQRLEDGQSLRDPPLKRTHGGIGGLGLAIAQRVAALHGGSLKPLPGPKGGTRLCLALPLAG